MKTESTEYTLTPDECALVDNTAQLIKEAQDEFQAVLRTISRVRKLEGTWIYEQGKLTKQA